MELTAAIQALETLQRPCRVDLHTDSQYLRRGVSEWLPGWIERGWRRKTGELQNEDLWRRLAAAVERHQIRWHWVKGHAGQAQNEHADHLATAAIRAQRGAAPPHGPPGPKPDFEVFLRVSVSPRGGGWAALIRPGSAAAGPAPGVGGGSGGAGGSAGGPKSGAVDAAGGGAAETVLGGAVPPGAAATSNAVDLLAAAAALEAIPAGASVAVHTVSDYLRLGATRWLPAWRQRGWKTQEGGPVQNRALWQRLAAVMAARRVTWPEVKGREIEELDRLAALAKAAATGR
jgi:ribonuclease HI